MSRGSKLLLVLLLGGFAVVVLGAGGVAAAVAHSGTVAVRVHEDGNDVRVAVPAALVRLAVALLPESALRDVADEAEPYLPALAAAWAELERAPDFTLLEIAGPDGEMRVEKRGGRILVLVDEAGARVSVGLPLGTVRALLGRFET